MHGVVNVVTCALWSGATCEMMTKFDAEKVWNRYGVGEGEKRRRRREGEWEESGGRQEFSHLFFSSFFFFFLLQIQEPCPPSPHFIHGSTNNIFEIDKRV